MSWLGYFPHLNLAMSKGERIPRRNIRREYRSNARTEKRISGIIPGVGMTVPWE